MEHLRNALAAYHPIFHSNRPRSVKDYKNNPIPKVVYLNGNLYKGEAGFINGYNGYTSTDDDGYLVAIIGKSAFDAKGRPFALADSDGNIIKSTNRRSTDITFK